MRKNGDNWVKLMVFLEVSVFSGIHNIAGENLREQIYGFN